MIRLGVNIDHIATVRNARGERYPNPIKAALLAEVAGADNITCHLREDRRHIKDADVVNLREVIEIPLNFEMAATSEMMDFACRIRPQAVTLVPEKREELTTEGGLDLSESKADLKSKIARLKEFGAVVSLFIEPQKSAIEQACDLGADAVEIHTGDFCRQLLDLHHTHAVRKLVDEMTVITTFAKKQNLQVHVGHGLNYSNAHWLQILPFVEEANIGHSIISHALFVGLKSAITEMRELLNNQQYCPELRQS